jgi:hypothetical protein
MPLVRVRILDGKTQLAAPSRPFAEDSSLQHVVGKALEPFPDCSVTVLDVFPDAAEVSMKKSQFFSEDFKDIKLSDVAAMGFFWVAHVTRDGLSTPAAMAGPGLASTSGSSSSGGGLADSLHSMMQRERGEEVTWPPPANGATFNVRIFNALLEALKAAGLGWHHADCSHADASGPKLIKALSHALHYALPFDLKGALARRAMHIPERFKANELKVCTPASRSLALGPRHTRASFARAQI